MNKVSVFDLVNQINNYRGVYESLGCGHIVGSAKEKAVWPCPKADSSGSSKSTKFRLHRDFDLNGKCIHNDVNDGHYMDVIDYVSWMYSTDKLSAAMMILDVVGVTYDDSSNSSRTSTIPTLTKEEIVARKKVEYENGIKRIDMIKKVWNKGVPLSQKSARDLLNKYLVTRGLPDGHVDLMPKHLRVSNNLLYPKGLRENGDTHAYYAGLLLPLLDEQNQPVTVHRHYFMKDSGSRVPETKTKLMMSPPWSLLPGTKVNYDKPYVWEIDGVRFAIIAIGEGVETMEAVRAATGLPVQPMYSSSLMQGYEPPTIDGVLPENTFLPFFTDKDVKKAGENSAKLAIERLNAQGYQCEMLVPPMDIPEGSSGVDWLDQWCLSQGSDFPSQYKML